MGRLAIILVFLTFLLIFWGSQVTTTDSGDSVPAWPASFFIPNGMPQVWELGHRWIAGTVGLLAVGLAVWVLAREPRVLPRRLAITAGVLVVVQAVVGGIRVLSQEKHVKAVVHALLAQAFLACVVALAAVLRASPASGPPASGPPASGPPASGPPASGPPALAGIPAVRGRAFALAAVVWLQAGLGAVLRHETRDKNPLGLALHISGALLVIVFAIRLAALVKEHANDVARCHLPSMLIMVAIGLQLVLGLSAWTTTHTAAGYVNPTDIRSLIPTAHVVLGAAILSLAVMVGMRALPDRRT